MRSKASWTDSTLYKYRCWSNDYHKTLLTKNEIYFSSVDEINDPYDCKIPLRYDLLTEQQWRLQLEAFLKMKYVEFDDQQIDEKINEIMKSGGPGSATSQQVILDNQEKYRVGHFGLFSSSLVCDHVMMWSHYGDSHQGFCIGFDQVRLVSFLQGISHAHHFFLEPLKVAYVPEIPELIPIEYSFEDQIVRPIEIKWDIWKYEEEVRLILLHYSDRLSQDSRTITLPEGMASEVILGSEASEQTKGEIVEVLRQRSDSISLFQIARKPYEFGLTCEPVNY